MSTGWNVSRYITVALMASFLGASALAATAGEKLDQAAELYKSKQYEQARSLLLEIDVAQLSSEQGARRNELVEEVTVAINQSNKSRRNLQDAEQALEANQRSRAAELFAAVQKNPYASDDQKSRARNGLATISRQQELDKKLAGAASRPAVESTSVVATVVAGEQSSVIPAAGDLAQAVASVNAGNEALAKGQLDLAEQRFAEALRVVPNYPDARTGLDLVRNYRRVEGKPGLLTETEQQSRAVAQRAEVRFRQNEREVRQAINDKQFNVAKERLEMARRTIEAARRDFSPEQYAALNRQIESLVRFADAEQRSYQQTTSTQQREEARKREEERRERDDRERQERIGQLFERVAQLRKERQYHKAADVLREILMIDPTYERAQFMLDAMEDAGVIKDEKQTRSDLFGKMNDALGEAENAMVPNVSGFHDQVIAFPSEEEWRIISERDPFGAGIGGEDETDRRTRDKLKEVAPPIDLPEGTSFEEAVNWIKEKGNVSVNVNWNALSALAVDRQTDTLGISLRNARYETIIKLLLDNVGGPEGKVDYDIVDGILRISTREDLDRHRITRVYDVSDLLVRIPSYSMESMMGGMGMMGGGMMGGMGGMMGGMGGGMMGGMGGGMMGGMGGGMMGGGMMGGGMGGGMMGGGMGGGYGGGGMGGSGNDEGEEDREEIIEDLEDLIKAQVEPGSWDPDGTLGSLEVWNDRMIVTHTTRAHQQLVELLRQLREQKDLQVSVESKFVRLQNNFLEQIGVDLDIVLNQGNAGLDNGLIPGSTGGTTGGGSSVFARDPITGVPLFQPRQMSQMGFVPAIPAAGQALTQTMTPDQPFGSVAYVPQGDPGNWWSRRTTSLPLMNNTLALAQPRPTGVPGSLAGENTPGFQMFGSFLDNLQVDFLLRATQLDARSNIVDAPRIVTFNNRGASINVTTSENYVMLPGYLPAPGSGVGGQAAGGRDPSIGSIPRGRIFWVLPTVSADRRYVTLQVKPQVTDVRFSTFAGATGPLQLPEMDMTTLSTSVNVPDRGWVLLGGLKQAGETEVEAGVPMVSKIPVLKRAFTNRSRVKDESILLILIKPTIMVQEELEENAYEGAGVSYSGNGN